MKARRYSSSTPDGRVFSRSHGCGRARSYRASRDTFSGSRTALYTNASIIKLKNYDTFIGSGNNRKIEKIKNDDGFNSIS